MRERKREVFVLVAVRREGETKSRKTGKLEKSELRLQNNSTPTILGMRAGR